MYFIGERTFTGQTPGIATVALNGNLLLRPYGTFPHPNVLAGFLLVGILFVASLWRDGVFRGKNTLQHIGIGSALLLGTVALFLTMSRVAIALFLLSMILFILQVLLSERRMQEKILYIGGFAFLLASIFCTPLLFRLQSLYMDDVLHLGQLPCCN